MKKLFFILHLMVVINSFSMAQDVKFMSEEVSYENRQDSITLYGTLTLPKSGKNFPAAIIITGSGAQDRDGTLFGHTVYKNLAEYLSSNGIAVLRVDDRGVKATKGSTANSTSKDFAKDVSAGIEFLKTRNEINPKKIGLIGHSEGGIVAPITYTINSSVAFIVSMAGLGITGKELNIYQNKAMIQPVISDPNELNRFIENAISNVIDAVINGKTTEERKKNIIDALEKYESSYPKEYAKYVHGTKEQVSKYYLSQYNIPWMRFFLALNPSEYWSKVKCPVLLLNGTKDTQVEAESNLTAIEKSLKLAKNRKVTIKRLEGLNHLFQQAQTGGLSEYANKVQSPNEEAMAIIQAWITKLK